MISGDDPLAGSESEHPQLDWRSIDAIALWPAVLLAALGVMVSAVATLGVPLDLAAPYIVVAWLVPVAVGLRRVVLQRGAAFRGSVLLLLAAAAATWLVGWEFSGHILPNTPSFAPDTWGYNAIAHYLEHHSRRQASGMMTLDQYATRHRDGRLLSGAMLALLRHLSGGVESANFIFAALCVSTHFLSMFFFVRALLGGRDLPVLAALLSTVAGWMSNAIMFGNYDNLLFLAFAPAFLGIVVRFGQMSATASAVIAPGFRWWILPAATLIAAMFYGYPEGLALLALISFPLALGVVRNCLPGRAGWQRRASTLVVLAGVTLLFIAPEISIFVGFLAQQMSLSLYHQGARPGEGVFAGLARVRFLPALFALGEEGPEAVLRGSSLLLSLLLLYLTVAGALDIGRQRRWYLWSGACLLVATCWFGMMRQYDYGVYKILFCSCWWIYPAIAAGVWQIAPRLGQSAFLWRAGAAIALLVAIGCEKVRDRGYRALPPGIYTIDAMRDTGAIIPLLGNSPLLVDMDNELDELWAVYYLHALRLVPIGAGASGYLQAAEPWLVKGRDAQLPVLDCRYALVSGLRAQSVWHDARCSLVKTSDARISQITNPYGIDLTGDGHLYWLGRQAMTLVIQVPAPGSYNLCAKRFWPGPSLPESARRTIQITNGADKTTMVLDPETRALPLHLQFGFNSVEIRCLDTPTRAVQANGDSRELLLGLVEPFVTPSRPH